MTLKLLVILALCSSVAYTASCVVVEAITSRDWKAAFTRGAGGAGGIVVFGAVLVWVMHIPLHF